LDRLRLLRSAMRKIRMQVQKPSSGLTLGLVGVLLAAAWWIFFWEIPGPSAKALHDKPVEAAHMPVEAELNRLVSAIPQAEANHRIEVVPTNDSRAIFYVNHEGRPVVGASVFRGRSRAAVLLSDQALATSDHSGWMAVDLSEKSPIDSLIVACHGFLSVSVLEPKPARYDIVMDRGSQLRFQCNLETGEPVSDVCVQVSKSVVPNIIDARQVLPGADGATMSAAGVSDGSGQADIGGIIGGKYLIHASHPDFVQVGGPTTVNAEEGGEVAVIKLEFSRPVGFVFEVEGSDVMTYDTLAQGVRTTGPTLSLARDYLDRFRNAYPSSQRYVRCVGVSSPDPRVRPSAVISIWSTDGHYVTLTRNLVPIDKNFKPEKLQLHQESRIPQGQVIVSAVGGSSDGADLLGEIYFRPLQFHSPRISVPRGGGRISLPCGIYVRKSDHPEIQRMLPRGTFEVRPDEAIEWTLDLRTSPRLLEWSASLSDQNTFRRLVLDLRDGSGRDVYRSAGKTGGRFWLMADSEYHASLRIGPYRCEQRIFVPHGSEVSAITFSLSPDH
jgi:hypothetical protein